MNEEFSYKQILSVLEKIYSQSKISNIINLSGGIVPYLISGVNSERNHGDIDFIVKKENMPIIRQLLQENNLYDADMDSLSIDNEDYGIDAIIDGIPIGFYPYSVEGDNIIQRSFTPQYMYGSPELKTRVMPQMLENDYIANYSLPNGEIIGTSSLEVIKATKTITGGREKDYFDIAQIDKIGTDESRYQRVSHSISNNQMTVEEKGKKL